MKFLNQLIIIFIFLYGCTPASINKKHAEPEKIKPEKIDPRIQTPNKMDEIKILSRNFIRIGIMEGETNILFSFSGPYSIYSKGKPIFSKKRSSGTWKVVSKNTQIQLENIETGERIDVSKELVFKPEQVSSYVRIGKIQSGKGWHWEQTRSRSYKGNIDFININEKITVVNEVGIEQYLYGVVPSEMSPQSPVEALKAQAILARTNVYSKIGTKYKNKPYSLTSDVYSQVYTGLENVSERTNKAVDDTQGMILTYNGKPLEALFHSVCGGYLEGNDIIWGSARLPYLQPKPCGTESGIEFGDLSIEKNLKKWIDSRPDSYCNIDKAKVDPALDFAKKYLRWETRISRKKLENNIRSSTGVDIGDLKDITVTGRGSSGKAKRVKITGTKRSVDINKELNIRKQLSKPPLYSANFYIVKENTAKNGLAESYIFKGAGFGHGAGMCQIGACGMAAKGKNFKEIIAFYFPGSQITDIGK
ncbi:MAG TPA: SpoIID/LytB domain-containing protein [Clostridiales bacterium]|nr:SpoIID/LytB domain-containing protein [Clostridiales bacterium]HQP70257.1 SpoIID/LytB domain-containing protein [Clostridiales bacterium]